VVVLPADMLAADKHTVNKDIVAAESVQAVDTRMDIEADNPTNVDIFYLFFAKPFSIHSFTNMPCKAIEDTSTDTLREDMHN